MSGSQFGQFTGTRPGRVRLHRGNRRWRALREAARTPRARGRAPDAGTRAARAAARAAPPGSRRRCRWAFRAAAGAPIGGTASSRKAPAPDGAEAAGVLLQAGREPEVGRLRKERGPLAVRGDRADQQVGVGQCEQVGAVRIRDIAGRHAGNGFQQRSKLRGIAVADDEELRLIAELAPQAGARRSGTTRSAASCSTRRGSPACPRRAGNRRSAGACRS